MKQWKVRYFTLNGTKLEYCEGLPPSKVLGHIELEKVTAIKADNTQISARYISQGHKGINIEVPGRVYFLDAASEDEFTFWMTGLNKVVASLKEAGSKPARPTIGGSSNTPAPSGRPTLPTESRPPARPERASALLPPDILSSLAAGATDTPPEVAPPVRPSPSVDVKRASAILSGPITGGDSPEASLGKSPSRGLMPVPGEADKKPLSTTPERPTVVEPTVKPPVAPTSEPVKTELPVKEEKPEVKPTVVEATPETKPEPVKSSLTTAKVDNSRPDPSISITATKPADPVPAPVQPTPIPATTPTKSDNLSTSKSDHTQLSPRPERVVNPLAQPQETPKPQEPVKPIETSPTPVKSINTSNKDNTSAPKKPESDAPAPSRPSGLAQSLKDTLPFSGLVKAASTNVLPPGGSRGLTQSLKDNNSRMPPRSVPGVPITSPGGEEFSRNILPIQLAKPAQPDIPEQLQGVINTLQQELDGLKAQNASSEKKIATQILTLGEKNTLIAKLEEKTKSQEEEIEALRKKLQKYEKNAFWDRNEKDEVTTAEMIDLRAGLITKLSELQSMGIGNAQTMHNIRSYRTEIHQLKTQVDTLTSSNQKLEEQNADLQTKLNNYFSHK